MISTSNKAALYARYSSDNQRTESIDAQLRAMRDYCKHNNIAIIETYIDEAKTATNAQRPAFQQMVSDSQKKNFNIVLVHKLDRFARSRYDSALYKHELKKNGVLVYSVLEHLDNSPESIMLESVLEGIGEYYSKNLSREVLKGLMENALQCKHTGGKPPLGYEIDPNTKKMVINPYEAEAVQIIFDMYAKGHGYTEIINVMDEKGFKTKRGNDFKKNSLYSILTNEKYIGTFIFNKTSAKSLVGTVNTHSYKSRDEIVTIAGGCPQIVSEQVFDRVKQRMEKNKQSGCYKVSKHHYLLTGKVFCKTCGKSMTGNSHSCTKTGTIAINYRCHTNRRSCDNKEINRSKLEKCVISILEKHIFNSAAIKNIAKKIYAEANIDRSNHTQEIALLNSKLAETNEAMNNIITAITTGVKLNSLLEKLTELERDKASIETAILKINSQNHTKDKHREIIIDPKHILEEYSNVKKDMYGFSYKEFIQSFIHRIEVGRYSVDITINTGLGIFPELNKTLTIRRQEIYKTHIQKAG